MKATLNLRFDKSTIEAAKEYAQKHGTSVSEIVESYLKKLTAPAEHYPRSRRWLFKIQ